jgi:uncharacterized protein (DUF2147 family)
MEMKRRFFGVALVLCALMLGGMNLMAADAVEGYWKTIDDKTKEVKSIVKIWQEDGALKGRIEKLFPKPGEDPDPICDKCKGDKKDKKILGMVFMWKFEKDGDEWVNGKILDPENGKVYHCSLELEDNGTKLNVFGYIKVLFKIGRTQTWLRANEADLN